MPKEITKAPLSGFFKFTELGQSVVGQVKDFFTAGEKNNPSMVLAPAMIRDERNGIPKRYASVAIGLSTDLRLKIDPKAHKGAFLLVEFVGKEKTNKGSDYKEFRVLILDSDEIRALAAKADNTHKGDPFPRQAEAAADRQEPDDHEDEDAF